MELTFLGTSSMVPTKERSHNAMFLSHKEEGILIDCGEGTQRQIRIAGIRPSKITQILLTHWHGDHVLGLPGLVQTIGASEFHHPLAVFGPTGSKEHFSHLKKAFVFEEKIDLSVHEAKPGVFLETDHLIFEAALLEHSVPCLGYSITEKGRLRLRTEYLKEHGVPEGAHLAPLSQGKDIVWKGKSIKASEATYGIPGKKVTIIMDTRLCQSAIDLARESDLLICEATFTKDLAAKARHYRHMTASDAAKLAKEAGAKKLILTHFSQRYKDASVVQDEASALFPSVSCAKDFMSVKI